MKTNAMRFKKKASPIVSVQETNEYLCKPHGLPLVIEAKTQGMDLGYFISQNKLRIESSLGDVGAVLFSGFAVDSIDQFHKGVMALGQELMNYEFASTPRTEVDNKVYTSTEYPSDQHIPMHNEMSYTDQWPNKVWFYCEQPSLTGGETPIVDSREVYRRMPEHIKQSFEQSGIRYIRNYRDSIDIPWQKVFNTSDPAVVEEYCKSRNIHCEWKKDRLHTWQNAQASMVDDETGETVWFNQAHLFHYSTLEKSVKDSLIKMFSEEDMPRNSCLGDANNISEQDIQSIQDIYNSLKIPIAWKKNDVLLLNNVLVAHGRNPYTGSRKVRVAMTK